MDVPDLLSSRVVNDSCKLFSNGMLRTLQDHCQVENNVQPTALDHRQEIQESGAAGPNQAH